jgi:hypothetical protein
MQIYVYDIFAINIFSFTCYDTRTLSTYDTH